MSRIYEIREYLEGGRSPFAEWFSALDAVTGARVDRHVRRMEQGNFGSSERVGQGVRELKIDFGPGYRVYYAREGETAVILLGGGSKRRQSGDIKAAQARWSRYKADRKRNH